MISYQFWLPVLVVAPPIACYLWLRFMPAKGTDIEIGTDTREHGKVLDDYDNLKLPSRPLKAVVEDALALLVVLKSTGEAEVFETSRYKEFDRLLQHAIQGIESKQTESNDHLPIDIEKAAWEAIRASRDVILTRSTRSRSAATASAADGESS